MIRYAVLLFNMIGLLAYRMFIAGGVEATQSVPANMKPGAEYTIEVTINKGATGGFAKFQQDLPEGFTATAVESKGASFSFTGTAVKFIWTSLPSEEEFKISYKVALAPNAPVGEKMLAGKFYYVVDNAKQSVDLEPAKVMVEGETSVASTNTSTTTADNTGTQATDNAATTSTTQQTDNATSTTNNANTGAAVVGAAAATTTTQTSDNTSANSGTNASTQSADNTNSTSTQTTTNDNSTSSSNTSSNNQSAANTGSATTQTTVGTQQGNVACTRKIIPNGGNDYTVEMTIKKGAISGFAKLSENIPAGFTATAGDLNKASFSFSEQKIKIVWVTLPLEPEFTISYKLSGSAAMANQVDGLLSYIENEETKKYVIEATAIGNGVTAANTNTATTNVSDNAAANNTATTTSDQAANNTNTQSSNNSNTQVTDNTNTNSQTTDNTNTQTQDNASSTATPSVAKVNYRVQICALKMSRMDNTYFERKYSFNKVDIEQHEGWVKYLVGGFSEYKNARDYREETKSKGVVGPFVTAYNSGRRITVQEALMISSQQWYK